MGRTWRGGDNAQSSKSGWIRKCSALSLKHYDWESQQAIVERNCLRESYAQQKSANNGLWRPRRREIVLLL